MLEMASVLSLVLGIQRQEEVWSCLRERPVLGDRHVREMHKPD